MLELKEFLTIKGKYLSELNSSSIYVSVGRKHKMLIDLEDLELFNKFPWKIVKANSSLIYVVRSTDRVRFHRVVIGIGGLLLQQHNRDDLGFAFKATYAEINGKEVELYKDPITDPGKKSHKGLMILRKDNLGNYVTKDQATKEQEGLGELKTVFLNGKVVKEYSLEEIRNNAKV